MDTLEGWIWGVYIKFKVVYSIFVTAVSYQAIVNFLHYDHNMWCLLYVQNLIYVLALIECGKLYSVILLDKPLFKTILTQFDNQYLHQ